MWEECDNLWNNCAFVGHCKINNFKLYYQLMHLTYFCKLARYWLRTACGWHDSVETCRRGVIICEIIVLLLVIVRNKEITFLKNAPNFSRAGKKAQCEGSRRRILLGDNTGGGAVMLLLISFQRFGIWTSIGLPCVYISSWLLSSILHRTFQNVTTASVEDSIHCNGSGRLKWREEIHGHNPSVIQNVREVPVHL
jgi:hypothetical protein